MSRKNAIKALHGHAAAIESLARLYEGKQINEGALISTLRVLNEKVMNEVCESATAIESHPVIEGWREP